MRRVVGVSLKMYFGVAQTRRWLQAIASLAREDGALRQVELFVAPSFLSLVTARDVLAGTAGPLCRARRLLGGRRALHGRGRRVDAREAGCTYVEVGHAERRSLFAVDDAVIARKTQAVVRAGLVPLVRLGETERTCAAAAARACAAQVEPVLDALPENAEALFAYEPVWAIGAAAPAPPEHVLDVALALRPRFAGREGRTRLIYGGSAGPGLFGFLAEGVDDLFLGRFAHDVANLRAILAEIGSIPDAGRSSG